MKIKQIHIQNYKSLIDFKLENPNPFSVFVGPNAAGKSNIFEALEYTFQLRSSGLRSNVASRFGGTESIAPFRLVEKVFSFVSSIHTDNYSPIVFVNLGYINAKGKVVSSGGGYSLTKNEKSQILTTRSEKHPELGFEQIQTDDIEYQELNFFLSCFSRIFLGNSQKDRSKVEDNSRLTSDGSNIEKVLNRIFENASTRGEILEILQALIPELKDIKIETSPLSGEINYAIIEKNSSKPFPKHLLSDGTRNILALLTALYQSDEPQFLCIEEPENGLTPYVIREFVNLCREMCEQKGHYIWLNTHSQTLVRQLEAKELILIDKINGETIAKQIGDKNFHGMKMDEAWLTNSLGGGLPW